MKYKFRIIPNEQTPELPVMEDPEKFIEENNELLIKFSKYVRTRKDAVGLASNQLSLNGERIMHRFCAVLWMYQWEIAVDPKIIKAGGELITQREGCLTWLGKKFYVDRHKEVTVTYFNLRGEKVTKDAVGLHAQIWQHEIDHLNGVEEKVEI